MLSNFTLHIIGAMKIYKELAILFAIAIVGEAISYVLPFDFPGTIIALILLLILLLTHIIKDESIKTTGDFLLNNMALFFIPATVGLIEHLELLKSTWWKIVLISFISFLLVFVASGYTVLLIQKLMNKRGTK